MNQFLGIINMNSYPSQKAIVGAGQWDAYGDFYEVVKEKKSLFYPKHPMVASLPEQNKTNTQYILLMGIKASCLEMHANAPCTCQMSRFRES